MVQSILVMGAKETIQCLRLLLFKGTAQYIFCDWEPEHVMSLRLSCGDGIQLAHLTTGRQEPSVQNTAWCPSEKGGQMIGVMPPYGEDLCDRSSACQYNLN